MLALDTKDALVMLLISQPCARLQLRQRRYRSEVVDGVWEARDMRLGSQFRLPRHLAGECRCAVKTITEMRRKNNCAHPQREGTERKMNGGGKKKKRRRKDERGV